MGGVNYDKQGGSQGAKGLGLILANDLETSVFLLFRIFFWDLVSLLMMISILSWNIHGLGFREKKTTVKDLLAKTKADFV